MKNIHEILRNKPAGAYVQFKREVKQDEYNNEKPDSNDDGFWPSENPSDAGFIGHNPAIPYAEQYAAATKRMEQFESGELYWTGVKAVANIYHKTNGVITHYTIKSAGIYGVESDASEEHLQELFGDQCADLSLLFAAMKDGLTVLNEA